MAEQLQQPALLQDAFGRRFRYLRLSITDVCNFRCTYCLPDGYQGEGMRGQLRVPEIRNLVQGFATAGTRKIRLTGGEPALRRDLTEIIATCAETPGIEQVAMTSNGHKLKASVDRWHDAGLSSLNVSIDSLDPASFKLITGRDQLTQILDGIDHTLSLGLPVKINSVLMREYSGAQFEHYLDWLKHTPVTLRFIELMQTGTNQALFDRQHVSGDHIIQYLLQSGWQEQPKGATSGPAREFTHADYQGSVGLIMPYSKDFCASCNRLRVSSRGQLHLCLFTEQGHDLRDLLQAPEQQPLLLSRIRALLGVKTSSHQLHQGQTGMTEHLSIIGG